MKAGNTNSCSQCNQNSRTNHDSVISTSTLESKPRPQALPSFSSLAVHQNEGGSGTLYLSSRESHQNDRKV